MNITTITIAGEEYKLSLTTSTTIALEKKLGKSALMTVMKLAGDTVNTIETPRLEELLIIFHGCLQRFNSNMSMEKVYQLYDVMCENTDDYMEGAYMELIGKVTETITAAFFGKKN